MNAVVTYVKPRLRAIVIIAALLLAVSGLVSYNRAGQAKLEDALASTQPAVRDAAVQKLVQNGRLIDTLINTQNPDEDKDSLQNQNSLTIRKNAADSVNRLMTENKITTAQSLDTLFALCKDADVKDTAETGLATLGGQNDANLKQMVARLSNGDPDIRGAAVDVLGKISGSKAAAAANSVLGLPAAQDSAISALQKIGAPSVPLIVAHLEDPKTASDIAFRQQMVGLLDGISSPDSVPQLINLAGQADQPSVQRLAQVALADTVLSVYNAAQTAKDAVAKAQDAQGKARDAKALADAQKTLADAQTAQGKAEAMVPAVQGAEATLSGVLQNPDADGEARAQAALALGRFADAAAVASLVKALGDFDARVHDAAVQGVQSAGPAAVGPLTAALNSGDVSTRAAAAQALGGIGTPPAVAALSASVASSATPVPVREGAVTGLGRSGNVAVIPTLVRALGDKDGAVATAAADGLLTPALEKDAVPALVAAFAQPTPVPFNASDTLSRMGALTATDVIPALTQAIDSGDTHTQTWAAVTLGEIGVKDAPVLAALSRLSSSPDPHVQYAASQAQLKLSGA